MKGLAILLFIPFSCFAQTDVFYKSPLFNKVRHLSVHVVRNDLDADNLKGPVKCVVSPDNIPVVDSFGNIMRVKGGLLRSSKYNTDGNIIEWAGTSATAPQGVYGLRTLYTYDPQGYVMEVRYMTGDSLNFSSKYMFYANAAKIVETQNGPTGNLLGAITYKYDSLGRLLEESSKAVNDTSYRIFSLLFVKYRYPENGAVIVENLSSGGQAYAYDSTITYARKDHVVSSYTNSIAFKDVHNVRKKYDHQGNEIEESSCGVDRKVHRSRTKYKYDSRGNWIVMTVIGHHTRDGVTTRQIEYY